MNTARLHRCARLTIQADYRRVFQNPKRSGDRYFTVLACGNELDYARLGLAISRKAAKAAVARNRIKRVTRESFRHHQQCLQGLDVVVIGRPNIAAETNTILFGSLQRHWQRLASTM